MIIDLDAHQGNGHEKDFSDDSMLLLPILVFPYHQLSQLIVSTGYL